MTTPADPLATPSRDLFFRVADRLQLEGCLHAVTQECKSVVVLSPSSALLDHYGQMLVQRLRQRLPDTSTEVFFPTDTNALIARFNTLLEHLSVDAATQLSGNCAPDKLWIVHDASALPEHELKLLLRLLQHFPGARISTVLLLGQLPEALRGVDPQGRRILRWDIDTPAPPQMEAFVAQAREQGREAAALELVSRVYAAMPPMGSATAPYPGRSTLSNPIPNHPAHPASTEPSAAMPPRAGTAPAPAAAPRAPERVKGRLGAWAARLRAALSPNAWQGLRQQWRMLLVVGALLAFSVTVALWLQPKPTARPTPGAAVTPPASTAASSAAPSASAAAPAIETELPEAAQQGLAWLRVIGPGVFVVDHGLFATAQEAQKKIGNARLYGARVLPHYPDGADTAQFMVITGPYPNEERARSFIQRVDPRAKVHPSASVLERGHADSHANKTR